ncbi:MAG: Hpt domain-containing protein [Planctomycetes bacterium]|nr:Hpt domain-containing protein [Planctomycetota bacterium]
MTDPIDAAVIDELRAILDDDAVAELFLLYLDDAPRTLAALSEAAGRGDAPGVRAAAHRLKGAAAGVGAHEVEGRAREVELEALAGRVDAERVAALRAAAARAEEALRGAWTDAGEGPREG